jgi:hypothetical protein
MVLAAPVLLGPIGGRAGVLVGAFADPITRVLHVSGLVGPTDLLEPLSRDQDVLLRPPVLRAHEEATDVLASDVDRRFLDMTDVVVARPDMVAEISLALRRCWSPAVRSRSSA